MRSLSEYNFMKCFYSGSRRVKSTAFHLNNRILVYTFRKKGKLRTLRTSILKLTKRSYGFSHSKKTFVNFCLLPKFTKVSIS